MKKIIFLSFCFSLSLCFAQEKLDKDVHVVKSYEPTISDAFKINILPQIIDTVKVVPLFNYLIQTKQIHTDFQLEPIRPAKMLGEPLTKLYPGYLKIGIGNYWTPFIDINYNGLRSKKYATGVNLMHISSNGKIKMPGNNDVKVFSGYSDNIAHIFGKKFYYKKTLSGDIKYCRNAVYFNNYDDTTLYDSNTILEKYPDNQQLFQLFNANTRFMTNYTDSFHFNYNIALNYDYFHDIKENYEHAPAIAGKLFNKFRNRDYLVGSDVKAVYFDRDNDTLNNTAIRINPWIGAYDNKWKVIVGYDMNVDIVNDKTEYYWYQQIKLQYNISENILLSYAGYSGKLEINNYKKIAFENPFIKPGLYVKNTDHIFLYAGIRGNISSNISFNLKATYSTINDMYFFVIDTNISDRNQFTVVYDDVKLTDIYGELSIEKSEKLSFLIKGNYYQYEMSEEGEIKPWHKPKYKLSFSSKYNIKNKIILNADIFALGMQYAKSYDVDDNKVIVIPQKLQEIIDINVGIEYRYTKILSAFINLNNIASAKYYKWNYYPIQRFNLLAGITYAFN